jgi:hypothetical protein
LKFGQQYRRAHQNMMELPTFMRGGSPFSATLMSKRCMMPKTG